MHLFLVLVIPWKQVASVTRHTLLLCAVPCDLGRAGVSAPMAWAHVLMLATAILIFFSYQIIREGEENAATVRIITAATPAHLRVECPPPSYATSCVVTFGWRRTQRPQPFAE